jgi:hypothetical protein
VRCQRHSPAALYPWERPGTHCTGGWVSPGAGLDRCRKSRTPHPLGFDPRTFQPVAMPTTLPGPWDRHNFTIFFSVANSPVLKVAVICACNLCVSACLCFVAFWGTEGGVNAYLTFEIKYSGSTKTYSDPGAYREFYIGGREGVGLTTWDYVIQWYLG